MPSFKSPHFPIRDGSSQHESLVEAMLSAAITKEITHIRSSLFPGSLCLQEWRTLKSHFFNVVNSVDFSKHSIFSRKKGKHLELPEVTLKNLI